MRGFDVRFNWLVNTPVAVWVISRPNSKGAPSCKINVIIAIGVLEDSCKGVGQDHSELRGGKLYSFSKGVDHEQVWTPFRRWRSRDKKQCILVQGWLGRFCLHRCVNESNNNFL